MAKLQTSAWLSHALCAPGQHTAKRRRKCTRQSRSCLQLCQIFTDFIFLLARGSVATYARCGGIFNIRFAANLPRNLSVKHFLNRFSFDRNMVMILWRRFFAHPAYTRRALCRVFVCVFSDDCRSNSTSPTNNNCHKHDFQMLFLSPVGDIKHLQFSQLSRVRARYTREWTTARGSCLCQQL